MDLTFIDTGAFIALFSKNDDHYEKASIINADLVSKHVIRITTNHVIDETCTWMLRYGTTGHRLSSEFGKSLFIDPTIIHSSMPVKVPTGISLFVIYSSPDIKRAAWEIFSRYDTARFSFTDCVSFAVMQAMGIKNAFTFDEHFDMMGFERL